MQPPPEYLKYKYRTLFGLDAYQMELEPADQFFTNLTIYGYIQEKKSIEMKKAQ